VREHRDLVVECRSDSSRKCGKIDPVGRLLRDGGRVEAADCPVLERLVAIRRF
jgi:hypothetical protein